jgi:protein dithiol oxidoreductase (disulfide-forming)
MAVARKRPDRRLILMRNLAIGFVAAVVVAIVVGGVYYGTGVGAPGEWVEGTHYRVLPNAAADDPGRPIRVSEFFSYGCVHCRNFEPLIDRWHAAQPEDIVLERVPVAFSPTWRLLAQAYYALEAADALGANHDRLFRAIHDNNREFASAESIADFVAGRGVDRDEFLRLMQSPAVRRAVRQAEDKVGDYRITGVPSLVVHDRYVLMMGNVSRRDALRLVDDLVLRIREERRQQASVPAHPQSS